jgi:hypothetical protein
LASFAGGLGLDQLAVILDEVSVDLGEFTIALLAGRSILAGGVAENAVLSVAAGQSSRSVRLARGAGATDSEAVMKEHMLERAQTQN